MTSPLSSGRRLFISARGATHLRYGIGGKESGVIRNAIKDIVLDLAEIGRKVDSAKKREISAKQAIGNAQDSAEAMERMAALSESWSA